MPEESRPRTETSSLSVKLVVAVMVAIAVTVGASAAGLWVFIQAMGGHPRQPSPQLPDQAAGFSAPRLRIHPLAEPEAYARRQDPLLNGWSWTDSSHATAHIPIDDAMRLLARRGWPNGAPPGGSK